MTHSLGATMLLAAGGVAFFCAVTACGSSGSQEGPGDAAGDSSHGGEVDTGVGVARDAAPDAAADTMSRPADATPDQALDAGAEAPYDARPDVPCSVQAQCNALVSGIDVASMYKPADKGVCTATELALFQKYPADAGEAGACLQCAFDNAVLDYVPPIPGMANYNECEDLGQTGDGGTEAGVQECMATLLCDLGLSENGSDSCGSPLYNRMASPMETLLLNAFCGAGVPYMTCNTSPMGACVSQWRAGFEGLSDSTIQTSNSHQMYPSGMANFLAGGLLSNCAAECFP
jgi:hypothetical protein